MRERKRMGKGWQQLAAVGAATSSNNVPQDAVVHAQEQQGDEGRDDKQEAQGCQERGRGTGEGAWPVGCRRLPALTLHRMMPVDGAPA